MKPTVGETPLAAYTYDGLDRLRTVSYADGSRTGSEGRVAPAAMELAQLLHHLRLRYANGGARPAGPGPRRGVGPGPPAQCLLVEETIGRFGDPGRGAVGAASVGWARREPGAGRTEWHRQSHFAEAICHAAIDRDLRVSRFSLEGMTAVVSRSKVDASTAAVVERITRSKLIVVDDIGLLPTAPRRPRPSTA